MVVQNADEQPEPEKHAETDEGNLAVGSGVDPGSEGNSGEWR
jgi:hypothetical protein